MKKIINKVKKAYTDIKREWNENWEAIPSEVLAIRTIRSYTIVEMVNRILVLIVNWVFPVLFALWLNVPMLIVNLGTFYLIVFLFKCLNNSSNIMIKSLVRFGAVINWVGLIFCCVYLFGVSYGVMKVYKNSKAFAKFLSKKQINDEILSKANNFSTAIQWLFWIVVIIMVLFVVKEIIKAIMQKAIRRDMEYKDLFLSSSEFVDNPNSIKLKQTEVRLYHYFVLNKNNPWREYEKMLVPNTYSSYAGYSERNSDGKWGGHKLSKKEQWKQRLNQITSVNQNVNKRNDNGYDQLTYRIAQEQDDIGIIKYPEFILQSPWPFKFDINLKLDITSLPSGVIGSVRRNEDFSNDN